MSSVAGFSSSVASTDFSVVHEIIRNHVRRGNSFAVLATLALPIVHEDPSFWRTCTYRGGLAAAAVASTIEGTGESQAPQPLCDEPADALAAGELYLMLRGAGGPEDPLLRRVMARLEDTAPGPAPEHTDIDLAEVCAVLQESCRARPGKRPREPSAREGTPSPAQQQQQQQQQHQQQQQQQHNREEIEIEEEEDEGASRGALEVIARMPALPGSTRDVASFDDVGEENAPDGHRWPGTAARLSIANTRTRLNSNAPQTHAFRHAARMDTNAMNRHVQFQGDAIAHPHVSLHAPSRESLHLTARASNYGNNDSRPRGPLLTTSGPPVPTAIPQRHQQLHQQQQQQRQRRRKFTQEEDNAILQGIARFAPGPRRFDSIFAAYGDVWHPSRTARHLYDHWRGTLRNRAVMLEEGYRNRNSLAFGNNNTVSTAP